MREISQDEAYAYFKRQVVYKHRLQVCKFIASEYKGENIFSDENFLFYKEKALEAQAELCAISDILGINGHNVIDLRKRAIGTKNELDSLPIVDYLDNYTSILDAIFQSKEQTAFTATIQVTEDCNLACTYCYQHNKTCKTIDIQKAKKYIDMLLSNEKKSNYLKPANEYVCMILEFIGGEPFLEIDKVSEITKYTINKMIECRHPWLDYFMISFSSNGTLFESEKVQDYIKRYKDITSISITVDGNKTLHDKCRVFKNGMPSYDIAHSAALKLKKTNGNDGTKITLSPENIEYMSDCFKTIIEDGFSMIHANFVYEKGWEEKHAKLFFDQVLDFTLWAKNRKLKNCTISLLDMELGEIKGNSDTNWCGGNGRMACLGADGNIYPCLRYCPNAIGSKQEKFIVGTAEEGFGTNKEQRDRIDVLHAITRSSQSTEECMNCGCANGCGWCSAYNYEEFGTPNKRATYICVMHKARSLATTYYNNILYIEDLSKEIYDIHVNEEDAIRIIGENNYTKVVESLKGAKKHADERKYR